MFLLALSFESATFQPDLLCFAAVQDLTIFMAPQGPAPFKWLELWGTTLHFVQWIQTQIIRTLWGRSIPCPSNVYTKSSCPPAVERSYFSE